jgi:hypothetical protein
MKTIARRLFKVIVCVAFLGCYALAVTPSNAEAASLKFEKNSAAKPLAESLITKLGGGLDPSDEMSVALADLNGDGRNEVITVQEGPMWNGSRGVPFNLFWSKDGKDWACVGQFLIHSLEIGRGTTRGWKNILLDGRVQWVWDGGQYVRR